MPTGSINRPCPSWGSPQTDYTGFLPPLLHPYSLLCHLLVQILTLVAIPQPTPYSSSWTSTRTTPSRIPNEITLIPLTRYSAHHLFRCRFSPFSHACYMSGVLPPPAPTLTVQHPPLNFPLLQPLDRVFFLFTAHPLHYCHISERS